jgi:hypothetical protein
MTSRPQRLPGRERTSATASRFFPQQTERDLYVALAIRTAEATGAPAKVTFDVTPGLSIAINIDRAEFAGYGYDTARRLNPDRILDGMDIMNSLSDVMENLVEEAAGFSCSAVVATARHVVSEENGDVDDYRPMMAKLVGAMSSYLTSLHRKAGRRRGVKDSPEAKRQQRIKDRDRFCARLLVERTKNRLDRQRIESTDAAIMQEILNRGESDAKLARALAPKLGLGQRAAADVVKRVRRQNRFCDCRCAKCVPRARRRDDERVKVQASTQQNIADVQADKYSFVADGLRSEAWRAAELSVNRVTLMRARRSGELAYTKLRGAVRYSKTQIAEWLERSEYPARSGRTAA